MVGEERKLVTEDGNEHEGNAFSIRMGSYMYVVCHMSRLLSKVSRLMEGLVLIQDPASVMCCAQITTTPLACHR